MQWTENTLSHEVIGCLIEVHRHLGPGLLESAYEQCLAVELANSGLEFERQKSIALTYKGTIIPDVYRLDFVVQGLIILELKSVIRLEPIFDAQLLTYLKLTGLKLGLLANFNVPIMKDGIKRMVLGLPE
jgi:GxxExxY protein